MRYGVGRFEVRPSKPTEQIASKTYFVGIHVPALSDPRFMYFHREPTIRAWRLKV